MTTIVLKNDFHGTQVRLRVLEFTSSQPAILSSSQVDRARRKLCGMAGCTCSGILGQRGKQEVAINFTWTGVEIYSKEVL